MEMISQLCKQEFSSLLIGFFVLLSSVIAIYEIIGRFSKIIGRPVKWAREKERDHNLLLQTVKWVNTIRGDLKNLTDIFVEKQINDYRWEIINFSNRVANGETCSKDSYRHCFATYEQYEKLLKENNLENGEVNISMEIINESYKQKLEKGF